MADLQDGESIEMQGSGAKPYVLKNVGGVYSCTCPAWRNQSAAIEKRTCKHLRKLRGDKAEEERIGSDLPAAPVKPASDKDEPPLLLAQPWDTAMDLTDWWLSEKLDGVRAYWDGKQFLSRKGNVFHAPEWFVEGLPETPLDGELWIARQQFQRTSGIVRRQDKSDHWKEIRYVVFDAPDLKVEFEERLAFLADTLPTGKQAYTSVLEHQRCQGLAHLEAELERILSLGGEGLMMRQPASLYVGGRSHTLLKIKNFLDAEATVIDHQPGKGKHKGKLGALVAQLDDGTEFSIGTGFSDKQRENPPPIGSRVTFRYQELSPAGVPRFPSFVRMDDSTPVTTPAARQTAKKKSTPIKSATVSKPAEPSASSSKTRYFEYHDEKSSKFWEISVNGLEVTVRYGRVGANGTTKTKEFADQAKADAHAEKLIDEKIAKGYVEQS